MTLATSNNKVSYVSSGAETLYDFDFPALSIDFIKVFIDNVEQGSGFTVIPDPSGTGGTVALSAPVPAGSSVVILRDVPLTQGIDYSPYGPFPSETHERGLDLGVARDQQLQEQLDRSLRFPPDSELNPTIGAQPGDLLAIDIGGNVIGIPVGDFAPDSAAQLKLDLANGTDPTKGAALVGYGGSSTVADVLSSVGTLKKYGAALDGVTDDTDAFNDALSLGEGFLDLAGRTALCLGVLVVPASSKVTGIRLSGGTLLLKSGRMNIERTGNFTIDLGGGIIDLGLKAAKLAEDAPAGNSFVVVDPSQFSVGDVVSCSFDLNGLPNDTSRSTLPGNVLNTIASISGNTITMTYPFTPNGGGGTPGYTTIPTGAWIINGIFTNPGIYYTGSGVFRVTNGTIQNASGGYYVSVNNASADFVSSGVWYDRSGLDGFNMNCRNIEFYDFHFGDALDVAKQLMVPKWTGQLVFKRGTFKRSNLDSEIYVTGTGPYGDILVEDVIADGNYYGGIASGFLSGKAFYFCVVTTSGASIGKVRYLNSSFNYARCTFGSGTISLTSLSVSSFEAVGCESNVNHLYATFSPSTTTATIPFANISGGRMECSTSVRQNPGFTDVHYNGVLLTVTGSCRYNDCFIDDCTLTGGSHIFDTRTVQLGTNTIDTNGLVLLQTRSISDKAKFIVPLFKASTASGTFFPLSNYIQSSQDQFSPPVEIDVPEFSYGIKFGNSNTSIRYRLNLYRSTETAAPYDTMSRHGVYIVAGSTVTGIGDNTLWKSTITSTSVMSANYAAGVTAVTQNASGTSPAVGDIFSVLYANDVAGHHYISAVSGNQMTISPGLREAITTTTLCALNKISKVY